MINPIYKFEITSVYGQTVDNKTVYPIYKSDLAVDWQIEQNEQYYRGKLSGKLNFIGEDFDFINSKNFETEFELRVFISYNAGASWTQYWTGKFYKTDCEFDVDDKKITVTPTVFDEYNDVVAGLEKEYNLIELKPKIQHIQLDKRPMIQVYSPGESVIACFLSGMYWEQDAKEITDESELINTYYFALCSSQNIYYLSGAVSKAMIGTNSGGFTFGYYQESGPSGDFWVAELTRTSDGATWHYDGVPGGPQPQLPLTLIPTTRTPATGNVKIELRTKKVYTRYVLDTEKWGNLNTYLLPADDIVDNNRNYRRCIGYAISDVIYYSNSLTTTPTKYGIYQPGQYYQPPYLYLSPELFPVARSAWDEISIWFSFSAIDWITEQLGRKAYTLKDAYPLSSVISVLLGQIAPGVKHEPTTDYSQFLYSNYNPLSGNAFTLFITQKSNILAGDYDQPAQKAPATLKMITDMLRDCFRCYWFIEKAENGDLRFRIEHVSWFLNGGSYSGTPVVGTDLTQMQVTRNGKKWAFATSKYEYDKPQMPERYQFGWMDDVTESFEGYPIDIQSKFVQPGNIEEINVANFTSDIDYMLLNPGACSEDGFALLGAKTQLLEITNNKFVEIGILLNNGNLNIELSDFRSTDFIDIPFGTKYIDYFGVFPKIGDWCGLNLYDNDRRFIAAVATSQYTETTGAVGIIDVAQYVNAKYIRATFFSGTVNPKIKFEDAEHTILSFYSLPYANFLIDGADHYLQNAYMAFYYLQLFYMWDMPAERIQAKNAAGPYVMGIKKQKNQQLQYPVYTDPNLYQLVKTNMGNGQIEKLSINLSSRTAKTTLRYDTE